jgi:non-specific serine/threonine protein kinase
MAFLHLGDLPAARWVFAASRALAQAAGDNHRAAVSGYLLGHAFTGLGDYARAGPALESGVAALRLGHDPFNLLSALWCLGDLLSELGAGRDARAALEESRSICRAVGEGTASLLCLGRLGQLAYREGDDEQATRLLEQALAVAEEQGFLLVVPSILAWLGRAVGRMGDGARAVTLIQESLRNARVNDRRIVAGALEGLALVRALQGQAVPAARLLGAAEALRAARQQPRPPADRSDVEKAVALAQGEIGSAAFEAARALGCGLSLERAIAEALETDDRMAPPTGPPTSGPLHSPVTAREQEVAGLIAAGLTNRQIATALTISPRTVDRHVENILAKLGLTSRTQIAAGYSQI